MTTMHEWAMQKITQQPTYLAALRQLSALKGAKVGTNRAAVRKWEENLYFGIPSSPCNTESSGNQHNLETTSKTHIAGLNQRWSFNPCSSPHCTSNHSIVLIECRVCTQLVHPLCGTITLPHEFCNFDYRLLWVLPGMHR